MGREIQNIGVHSYFEFSGLEKDPEAILKASFDAKYLTHEDYSGSVITDLMGNVVSDHGENFNSLNDNTQFIVYRLMERKYWFRTFIRIC